MVLDIRIAPTSDEQYQEILDTLRPLRVEVVTGEQDPLVAALFYVARINSKLDNLGQLRHVHDIARALPDLQRAAKEQEIYYKDLNTERTVRNGMKRDLYTKLARMVGKEGARPSTEYMTEKEIVRSFFPYFKKLGDDGETIDGTYPLTVYHDLYETARGT